jgi:cytochrome oxidase Cu insertion factor (SCO1/SenC/PrrC family)
MPGMGRALQSNDPTVALAFRTALMHQLLIIIVMLVVLALAWNTIRTIRFRRAVASGDVETPAVVQWPYPEPTARRLLRITFGVVWIFDGLLQVQGGMPLGLADNVLTPAGSSSPAWVQHLVNVGTTIWSDHPVTAAASTVWIQVGVGIFLLVAPRGYWSRAAGVVSVGWGLVVWVFGEAFGGIFGHGSSWLFGSPGAVLFYVVAGALVALPDAAWESPKLGRNLLRVTGVFFIAMGILQAWPGRGFWAGQTTPTAAPGNLTAMATQMSQLSQPSIFSSWIRAFGSFDAGHGWGVNLLAVLLLVGIGICLASGNRRLLRIGVVVGALVCLADWVFVQDFGFFGGLGTDPNSMVPMVVVLVGGYVAVVRLPVAAKVSAGQPAGAPVAVPTAPGKAVLPVGPPPPSKRLDLLSPSYLIRYLAALGAVGIVLVGAAPMALASTDPNADPILAVAQDGTPNMVDYPAPAFTLTDQHGTSVSSTSLAGRTVVLTFLDPVCTSDCPLIAQELRVADTMLGSSASNVELVAVVNNPLYSTTAMTNAFDRQEGLDRLSNWKFLTGPLPTLNRMWRTYGVQTQVTPAGSMVAHSDILYIIDKSGQIREILSSDPGSTAATHSSISALISDQVQRIAHS